MRWWRGYKYKHLSGMAASFVVAYLLSLSTLFEGALLSMGEWGIVGAFIGGILFVNSLTVGIGAIMLLRLQEHISAVQTALVAGYGTVIAGRMMVMIEEGWR